MGRLLAFVIVCGCVDSEPAPDDGALVVTAGPAPDVDAPGIGKVTFGRDTSERINGVRIRDKAHTDPKVVYSVRLADVQSTEKLFLRGEVTLSRCNPKDIAGESGDAATTPCDRRDMRRNPYDYAPRFSAAFVLATSATDPDGKRVSDWFDRRCTEGEHHCALALPEARIDGLADEPELFVNLVVSADAMGHDAHSWDVMEVEQHHGLLAVTRVGAGAGGHAIEARTQQVLATARMGIDRPAEDGDPTQVRRRILRARLDGLQGGDVVDVDAVMRAELVGSYTCDPLITTEAIITADPSSKQPDGPHDKSITIKNGANCADHNGLCRYEDSGAFQLDKNAPSTMYVSMIALAVRSCAAANGSDRWQVEDGSLGVNVRR